jgi:hypothetical protein
MYRKLIYLSFSLILFTSCEEYYTPSIDTIDGQLVVEAQITNDPSKNFVHISKTLSFYDDKQPGIVSGATVDLVENDTKIEQGTESDAGYFNFSTVPETGKNYKLRIIYQNNTYESEVVTMPPLPNILNAYSGSKVKRIYKVDSFGTPAAYDTKGLDNYVDAPATDALAYYRFSTKSIIEWIYVPVSKGGPPPPPIFGWKSYYANSNFNIAGPKTFSQTVEIDKHPILWLASDSRYYLSTDTLFFAGWILIVDQYGTSKGSYEYHEKLNSQFAADGSLFDPIQTQIYGNITCKTDPAKIVYGYFDLNSYRQYRYATRNTNQEYGTKLRQILRYPDIPDFGQIEGGPPAWWE